MQLQNVEDSLQEIAFDIPLLTIVDGFENPDVGPDQEMVWTARRLVSPCADQDLSRPRKGKLVVGDPVLLFYAPLVMNDVVFLERPKKRSLGILKPHSQLYSILSNQQWKRTSKPRTIR